MSDKELYKFYNEHNTKKLMSKDCPKIVASGFLFESSSYGLLKILQDFENFSENSRIQYIRN
jgi:hypothetical protein